MILNAHYWVQLGIITDEAWDKLSKDQQNYLIEAGKYASEYNREISEDAEKKVFVELKAAGVNIVEVDDVKPWQDACKDVISSASANNPIFIRRFLICNKFKWQSPDYVAGDCH